MREHSFRGNAYKGRVWGNSGVSRRTESRDHDTSAGVVSVGDRRETVRVKLAIPLFKAPSGYPSFLFFSPWAAVVDPVRQHNSGLRPPQKKQCRKQLTLCQLCVYGVSPMAVGKRMRFFSKNALNLSENFLYLLHQSKSGEAKRERKEQEWKDLFKNLSGRNLLR